ncbi:NF038130 family PEP-CTERM protein [Trichocoleus desertorum AS-A10]|uniref:NF038130 family PEP-CTERM protein n=1 Tax=Trichocoleus desertorum TaxID=1481672 RepID=UPI003297CD24
MVKSIKRLIVGASVFATVSAIANAPTFAASIVNATVGGNASFLTYTVIGGQTVVDPTNNVQAALDGDSSAPGGNVELFSNSEAGSLYSSAGATSAQKLTAFNNFLGYNEVKTLDGQLNGKNISLSSLTAVDWLGASNVTTLQTALGSNTTAIQKSAAIASLYNSSNLATTWFNTTLTQYGMAPNQNLFSTFLLAGGLQRFSDPNISYVNQDDQTGLIKIGLAGHFNAAPLLGLPGTIQASELVKVSYNGQASRYLRSYQATKSGLISKDGTNSHTGNYEVSLQGELPPKSTPESVPEPSLALGLFSLGGLFAAKRKLTKQASN